MNSISDVTKLALDELFSGNITSFQKIIIDKVHRDDPIDKEGLLKPHYRQFLLHRYRFSSLLRKKIIESAYTQNVPLSSNERKVLFLSGLIGSDNNLTAQGKLKAVELSPQHAQAELLGIDVDKHWIKPCRKGDLEINILSQYVNEGFQGNFDEGRLLRSACRAFIYSSRRYFHEISLTERGEELVENHWKGSRYFDYVFEILMSNGPRAFRLEDYSLYLDLDMSGVLQFKKHLKELVNKSIALTSLNDYLLDVETISKDVPDASARNSKIFSFASDGIKVLIDIMGESDFRNLCRSLIENNMGLFYGWPDLTLYDNRGLHLVEVKGPKDKLNYAQVELIDWFVNQYKGENISVKLALVSFI